MQQLVQLHLDGMDRALRNDKPQRAQALLTDLARIAPDNPNIALREAELELALARQQERQRQLGALIRQAAALSAEDEVAQRRALYAKVLAIDPGNQAALTGLQIVDTEIANLEQRALQQSRENAQSLMQHAQQLLAKRPASPDNFSRARQLLLESQRQSPGYSAVDLQLKQLPQRYVEAVQRKIEQEKYGEARVSDTGIREATIVGQAIGMALRGLRPIAEIQYLDYILYALQILSDDLASLRWRTKGGQRAPVIIRTRGHRLEGVWHSGSPMAGVIHLCRGLMVCVPRDATRAAGFYNTLLRSSFEREK